MSEQWISKDRKSEKRLTAKVEDFEAKEGIVH